MTFDNDHLKQIAFGIGHNQSVFDFGFGIKLFGDDLTGNGEPVFAQVYESPESPYSATTETEGEICTGDVCLESLERGTKGRV